MSLTIPQIIMLNHAAHVSHERNEAHWAAKRDTDGAPKAAPGPKTKVPDFANMTSEAIVASANPPAGFWK
jgi:hypothetical protein